MSDIQITTDEDKVSYGLGINMGQQLVQGSFAGMNLDLALQGVADVIKSQPQRVSNMDLQAAFQAINEKLQAEERAQAEQAIAAGKAFLAENAKRDEVTVTESGLQYEVLLQGSGPKPAVSDTVRTHYHGTLIDGTVFDSSVERGQPAEFPVGGVIRGWTEALQLMPAGSKWKLYIPSELAYGERGAGGDIGPHTTLVFEVELLEIV